MGTLFLTKEARCWKDVQHHPLLEKCESKPHTSQNACMLNHKQLFVTLWIIGLQAPLSMGCCRQEYWSVLTLPSPRDIPNSQPGSPALQADSLPLSHQGSLMPALLAWKNICSCWGKRFWKPSVMGRAAGGFCEGIVRTPWPSGFLIPECDSFWHLREEREKLSQYNWKIEKLCVHEHR